MEITQTNSGPSRRSLLVIAAVVAVAYLACVNGKWYPTPDSALYMGLGRSLATGQGYTFNGHADNTVTPGLPLAIAAGRLVQGGEGLAVTNLLITLLGLAGLAIVWAALRRLTDAWLATAATVMLAGSTVFFQYSHIILTDVPFITFAYAALYACIRFAKGSWLWLAAAAVLTAIALTIRAPGALFMGLVAVAVAIGPVVGLPTRRRIIAAAVLLAATLATVGVWYLWGRSVGRVPYQESAAANLGQFGSSLSVRVLAAGRSLAEAMSRFMIGTTDLPWLGAIGWAVTIFGLGVLWRRGLRLGLLVVVPYTIIIVAIIRQEFDERYLLPVLPLILLGLAQGVLAIVQHGAKRHGKTLSPRAVVITLAVLAVAVVLSNTAVDTRKFAYETACLARTGEYYQKVQRGKVKEQLEAAHAFKALPPATTLAAERAQGRILYYFSGRTFVELPKGLKWRTAQDADALAKFLGEHPEIDMMALPLGKSKDAGYEKRLAELFPAQRTVYSGKSLTIYSRHKATTAPGK